MSESLGSGTYEVLRNRLRESATDLRQRFDKLNAARSSVFGNIETKLSGTAHVSTGHNCIPRDLLSFGDRLRGEKNNQLLTERIRLFCPRQMRGTPGAFWKDTDDG